MSPIRSRVALAGAALVLATGAASGGALVGAGGDATAAPAKQAKPCKAAKQAPGANALRQTIRAALKDARDGDRKPLTPDELRAAVAPAVAAAVKDGNVPQQLVDRRAARLRALSDALGG